MGSLPILDIKSFNEYIPENDQCIMFENENNTCINNLFAMGTYDDIILNIGKYLKYNQLHYIDLDTLNSNLNIDVKKNDVLVFNHDLNNDITKIYKSIEPVQKLTENMAFFKKDFSSVLFVDKNFNNRTLFVENYNNDLIKININIENDNNNDIILSKKKNKEFNLDDKKQKKSKKIKDRKSDKKNKDDFDMIKISTDKKAKSDKIFIELDDKKEKKDKKIKKEKKSKSEKSSKKQEFGDEFDKLKISKIKKEKKIVNDSKNNKDKSTNKLIKKFDLNDKQKNIYEENNNDNNNLNAKLLTNYKNVKNNKMSSYILEKNIDDEGNCEILFENDNIDIDLEEIKDCNLINLKFKNEQNKEDVANATVDVKSILNNSKNSKKINVSAKEMEEVKPLQEKNTSSNNDNVMTFFIILIIVVILGLLFYFFYYKKRNANLGDGFQLV